MKTEILNCKLSIWDMAEHMFQDRVIPAWKMNSEETKLL